MPPITVMIKPASGMCNMRCKYCFYADETSNRQTENYGFMSEDTLYNVLKNTLKYASGDCTIAFQGGEPTLAGLSFFEKVIELQKELNVNNCRISNALQTNAYNLGEDWAQFFAQNNFLVGVSLDGPADIHDKYRIDAKGEGTYKRVMRTIQLFDKHKVEYNILTVVTSATCKSTQKITGFFDRNNFEYRQYIPCLDPLNEKRGEHEWSLTPKLYAKHLTTLFNSYYSDALKGKKRYHRYFDNLLMILNRQRPEACGMEGRCSYQYVVEADGSVFPCDFYMLDEWKIGNFNTDSVENLMENRTKLSFVEQSIKPHDDCLKCKWAALCRGGCRRDRDYFENDIGKNYFCSAYKQFFEECYPQLVDLYNKIMSGEVKQHGEG